MLRELGAATIDADVLYHKLIGPGSPLAQAIASHFGDGVLTANGAVDRHALGAIVFADAAALIELERLTHPAVITAALAHIARLDSAVAAIDAVKLIESGLADRCDEVWLVACDPAVQVERLIARNGLSRADALLRISAQTPIQTLRARADSIIDNSRDLSETRAQVERAWCRLPILHI
jgi:dephospho-CoA kinase